MSGGYEEMGMAGRRMTEVQAETGTWWTHMFFYLGCGDYFMNVYLCQLVLNSLFKIYAVYCM